MKFFNLSIGSMIMRYFLLMGVVIAAGFIGQWWLAILALPIFLSAILGLGYSKEETVVKVKETKKAKASKDTKAGVLNPSFQ